MPLSVMKARNVYASSPRTKLTRHWLVEKEGWVGGSRDVPKAYKGHYVAEVQTSGTWQQTMVENNWDVWIESNGPWSRVESKLHAKIADALGERSELGTTIYEWRSAADMVTHNAKRLALAALMVKRGRFKEFLNVLNVKPLPKHKHWTRSSPKVASTLWIEYWFGIAPTINDIQTAVAILDSDPSENAGWTPYKVSTGARFDIKQSETYYLPMLDVTCVARAKAGGEFRMVNPNTALAQRLGLLNPLTIALNVTPWSWLLGWFINLNQWVDSISTFAGYQFRNTYVTKYTTFDGLKRWKGYADFHCFGYYMKRELRLPTVKLHFKNFNLSSTRAATAVSLLTLRLKSL